MTRWGRCFRCFLLIGLGLNSFSNSSYADSITQTEVSKHPYWINPKVRPLGLLYGIYGIAADIYLGGPWMIAPGASFLVSKKNEQRVDAEQYGISVGYQLSGDRAPGSDWVARSFFYYMPVFIKSSVGGEALSGTLEGTVAGLTISRQWMAESGLNLSLGVGAAYYLNDSEVELMSTNGSKKSYELTPYEGIEPVLDFCVGWAF